MTTKHDVIRVHQAHPTWNSGMIARELGCAPEYVRSTAKRNNLTLPKGTFRLTKNILELGIACDKAGLSVADIEAIASAR
jgi:hypothetical protein